MTVGKIDNLPILNKHICPKEKTEYSFNNITYTLRAEGDIIKKGKIINDNDEIEPWHEVKNYKLFIKTANSNEQLFIIEDSFNDTFVTLIFVGDLDRDRKLDFIFQANRDYEENRIILFLSSEAEENNLLRKVSEISIQFDC